MQKITTCLLLLVVYYFLSNSLAKEAQYRERLVPRYIVVSSVSHNDRPTF